MCLLAVFSVGLLSTHALFWSLQLFMVSLKCQMSIPYSSYYRISRLACLARCQNKIIRNKRRNRDCYKSW